MYLFTFIIRIGPNRRLNLPVCIELLEIHQNDSNRCYQFIRLLLCCEVCNYCCCLCQTIQIELLAIIIDQIRDLHVVQLHFQTLIATAESFSRNVP